MHFEELLEMEEDHEIAEAIHELKKEGEQFLFWNSSKRLVLAREIPYLMKNEKTGYEEIMIHVSKILGIKSRKTYEMADQRFNLTMY